tara:strand:- start:126 stop:350 length:225 start_codon:yes stop_codon:yes gene_type:complete
MKEYVCEVNLVFSGNNFEAKNKKEYVEKVKNTFKDEFNIELDDEEITNIQNTDENYSEVELEKDIKNNLYGEEY